MATSAKPTAAPASSRSSMHASSGEARIDTASSRSAVTVLADYGSRMGRESRLTRSDHGLRSAPASQSRTPSFCNTAVTVACGSPPIHSACRSRQSRLFT